ncbi:glycosyltransferase [Cyclobacteriaceae bacterium YHN15]|nr:glycosyltransferase [Cyclobacteriaceae bacterium YHN15]
MKKFPVFLSVVTVIKDQEDHLEAVLEKAQVFLKDLVLDWELIVVDNASQDNSLLKLKGLVHQKEISNVQVYALTHSVDRDIAYWAGLENSLGDFVVIFDPVEDDLSYLKEMLQKAVEGFDVVFAKNNQEPNRSLAYRVSYGLFNKIFKWFNGVHLAKEAPNFRVFSRNVVNFILRYPQPAVIYRHLPATGGFTKTVLEYYYDAPSSQKRNLWKGIDRGMRLLVSTTRAPMRLVTSLSLFGAFSNLLYSIYVLAIWFFKEDVAPGWVSMSLQQSGMFFLISLVLLVLGEYILNMASLSNDGPLYHIGQEFKSHQIVRSKQLNVEDAETPESN